MSICTYCGAIGGYHYFGCSSSTRERRIELAGNLKVYVPVKPKTQERK